jgi:hypothetical protein
MVIAAFLSPGGLSAPSLGAATRLHIVRSAIHRDPALRAVAFEEAEPGFADGGKKGTACQSRLTGTWPATAMVAE